MYFVLYWDNVRYISDDLCKVVFLYKRVFHSDPNAKIYIKEINKQPIEINAANVELIKDALNSMYGKGGCK